MMSECQIFTRAFRTCTIRAYVTANCKSRCSWKTPNSEDMAEGKSATRTFELCGIDICVLESFSSTTSGYHHLIAGRMSFHHKIQHPVKDMEAPLGKKQLFLHTKVLKHKKLLGEVWLPGWRRKQSPLPPARLIVAFSTAFSATRSVKLQEVLQHVGRNFTTALLKF